MLGRITEAVYMANARRKIHDVHVRAPTNITIEVDLPLYFQTPVIT